MSEGQPFDVQQRLRALPAVSTLLETPGIRALEERHGHAAVVRAIRTALDVARRSIRAGAEAPVGEPEVHALIEQDARSSLRPVLNASGVVVHTNLGRAPLAEAALRAVSEVAHGYSTLEYSLHEGRRGSRHGHATALLSELTGAEDAAVVNNNAAAVLLVLSALAADRDVIVSRGELVEIGGGFRIPDVMRQSGARLVEVGTTNRTHLADYERAIDEGTGLLLKVHRSNFDVVGFTAEVALDELAELSRARGIPLMYDAGSGGMRRFDALPGERPTSASIADGVDVVTFSGDKLLGGPQAGLIVGRREILETVRRHPLMRAVRPDKLCLAALEATLRLWRDRWDEIPVARMMTCSEAALEARAVELAALVKPATDGLKVTVERTIDRVGGGASPLAELPGWAVRVDGPDPTAVAARLRAGEPPVVSRVEDSALWLHLRCVRPQDDGRLVEAVIAALSPRGG